MILLAALAHGDDRCMFNEQQGISDLFIRSSLVEGSLDVPDLLEISRAKINDIQ